MWSMLSIVSLCVKHKWIPANISVVLKEEIETAMQLIGMTDLMRDAGPIYLNTSSLDHLLPAPYSSPQMSINVRSPKL